MPYCEAASSPVLNGKSNEYPKFPLVEITLSKKFAGENVGMNDIDNGGHEVDTVFL